MGLSYIEVYFNIFVWALLVFLSFRALVPSFPKMANSYKVFYFLAITFATFGYVTGDFFHYQEIFENSARFNEFHHVEKFYSYIGEFLGMNYMLWRFVIWSIALLLYIYLMKRLRTVPDAVSLSFALFSILYFCSHRQILAFCVAFVGVVLLLDSSKKIGIKILGLLIIAASLLFHRSMPIYLCLIVLALIPYNRYVYVVMLCAFPIVSRYFGDILGTMVDSSLINENLTRSYIDSDFRATSTIWGIVGLVVTYAPIYLLLIYAIYQTTFKKEASLPREAMFFLRLSFLQIYLAHLFQNQGVSSFLTTRFLEDSVITLGVFYSVFITKYRPTKFIKTGYSFLLISCLYNYMYFIYKM